MFLNFARFQVMDVSKATFDIVILSVNGVCGVAFGEVRRARCDKSVLDWNFEIEVQPKKI